VRTIVLPVLASLALIGAPAAAQSADQAAAYQVVTRLFDSMRARDTAAMRASFVANASMQSLGDSAVKFDAVTPWIEGIGRARAGLLLDERLANPVIHVDANLATVWVDYWFFAGDRLSHCGVDAFQLTKHSGAWRIFSVVDTRRTQDCAPPPPR